jgi:metallophosphoesterase superfamily enzyme
MDPPVYDTLILSDVHLGAETSRAREATSLLKNSRFRRLILLGDIFADLNFGRLTKEHWKFLGQIRKLSNPKRNIEVVWVEGNHDQGLTDEMRISSASMSIRNTYGTMPARGIWRSTGISLTASDSTVFA